DETVLVWMQAEHRSSHELARPRLYNSGRAIAVFYWKRKRALLVGAAHAVPLASAHLAIEYETLGASADPAEERAHQRFVRPRSGEGCRPQRDCTLAGIPKGAGHAGLAGRAARHHVRSRAVGAVRIAPA